MLRTCILEPKQRIDEQFTLSFFVATVDTDLCDNTLMGYRSESPGSQQDRLRAIWIEMSDTTTDLRPIEVLPRTLRVAQSSFEDDGRS